MKKFSKKVHHEDLSHHHHQQQQHSEENSNDINKLPIVYTSHYSVKFCGLQKLHPFDSAKGHHIMQILKSENFITDDSKFYKPNEISENDLLKVHTKDYIQSLKWSLNAARIAEIPLLFFVPNKIVQRGYLRPMRFQTAGSILAGKLALQDGWAINLGGGFHHCCSYKGGGFCPYADITLLIKRLLSEEKNIKKIMIIDLDAHQGNGHERDFMNEQRVYILDMYNSSIYPKDNEAKLAIKCAVELPIRTQDNYYLKKLKESLTKSLNEFTPDLIVYNAGTDILINDPLGLLSITPSGVIQRDEMVFRQATTKKIPIVMLLSGGYLRSSAKVIADSIMNLKAKSLISTKM